MNFGFKVFRVLTGINLFITGFVLLFIFLMVFFSGMGAALIVGFLFGGVFIHAMLCAYLQRSLTEPGFTLKESTPGGILFLGIFSMLLGLFFWYQAIKISIPEQRAEMIAEVYEMQPGSKDQVTAQAMDMSLSLAQFLFSAYGITIVANAILAMIYLQQWRKKQSPEPERDQEQDF